MPRRQRVSKPFVLLLWLPVISSIRAFILAFCGCATPAAELEGRICNQQVKKKNPRPSICLWAHFPCWKSCLWVALCRQISPPLLPPRSLQAGRPPLWQTNTTWTASQAAFAVVPSQRLAEWDEKNTQMGE